MPTGYRDIGVYQHKSTGGDAAKTGYVSIGVYQEQDAAAITPAGGAPSLIQGTVIIPGTGSLEFGELGGPTPGTGALALIGQTPTVLVATFLTPAAGAVTVDGLAPGRVVGSLF